MFETTMLTVPSRLALRPHHERHPSQEKASDGDLRFTAGPSTGKCGGERRFGVVYDVSPLPANKSNILLFLA